MKQEARVKRLNKHGYQEGTCNIKPRLNTLVDKVVAAGESVKSKTLVKDGVLEKRVLENDGKDDSTTKQCENICTFEETKNVTLFNKNNYEVFISIGAVATEMHPGTCVFNMTASPNLIREKFFRQGWHKLIGPDNSPDVKSTTSESVRVLDIITLHVRMGDGGVRVDFGVVRNLVVNVLLGTNFIDRFAKDIFKVGRKVVFYNFKPAQIMMLTL